MRSGLSSKFCREFERQKESQEKERLRKERSRKRLSQVGDAWQLLTQEGVNENLELEEQEDEESIGDEEELLSGTENVGLDSWKIC